MKKLILSMGLLFAGAFACFSSVLAFPERPVLELYYGRECPHCHREMQWLPKLQEMYPDLKIEKYEVWHDPQNQARWEARMQSLGMEASGVPTNIIKDEVVVGFGPEQRRRILALMEKYYGAPAEVKKESALAEEYLEEEKTSSGWKAYLGYSWPVMSFLLGLVDGVNPCAMWALLMLISFLLTLPEKSKRWLVGGIFLLVSGLMYGAVLLAYLFGFQQISAFLATKGMSWLFYIVGVVAIWAGIMALWHALRGNVECKVSDQEQKRRFAERLKSVLQEKNIWVLLLGVSGLALSVNAIELLCSFAIPTAFTAALVQSGLPLPLQLVAILIYDIAYMLDDIIMFVVAMMALNVLQFSTVFMRWANVLGGVILVILGALLLFAPETLSFLFTT